MAELGSEDKKLTSSGELDVEEDERGSRDARTLTNVNNVCRGNSGNHDSSHAVVG